MKISIHQPMYLPWAPYIAKLMLSDVFVLYDTVQYPGGRGFTNRNYVYQNNSPLLLTLPIEKHSLETPIHDIKISNENNWYRKHSKTIWHCYNKNETQILKNFLQLYELENIDREFRNYCLRHLEFIVRSLNLKTKIVLASDLIHNEYGLNSIISIVKKLEGTTYISGDGEGSKKFLKLESFDKNDIDLKKIKVNQRLFSYSDGKHRDGAFIDLFFTEGKKSREILMENTSIQSF